MIIIDVFIATVVMAGSMVISVKAVNVTKRKMDIWAKKARA